MPLPENIHDHQEADGQPISVVSLIAALSRYSMTSEANKILAEHEDEGVRIAKLRALLKTAPSKLDAKLRQAAADSSVINSVSFQRLRSILQICDVLERRDAFFDLLEDHGLDPRAVLC
ncbi:hypothetical protein KKA33_01555 [Patescibacteria group bacterium]|nr:hypothetical protein [Patescibacteria group bacterium]